MTSLPLCLRVSRRHASHDCAQHLVNIAEGKHHEATHSRGLRRVILLGLLTPALLHVGATAVWGELTQEQLEQALLAFELHSSNENWFERNEVYLGPLAILVSAFASWILANRAIKANRDISQKRATFDYMSHLRWDKDFIEATRTYLECRRGSTRMAHIAEEYEKIDPNNGELTPEQQNLLRKHDHIKRLLNEYEAIAVGINSGALSEEVVVRNYKQAIISTVDECKDFIEKTREHAGKKGYSNPECIYIEIQEKVESWNARKK